MVIYIVDCYDNWRFFICDFNVMFEKKVNFKNGNNI